MGGLCPPAIGGKLLKIWLWWGGGGGDFNQHMGVASGKLPRKGKFVVNIVNNTISLSHHEQVCLMRLRFKKYFSHHQPDNRRNISRNVALITVNILVHDMIKLIVL